MFQYTMEEELVIKSVREFVENEVKPKAMEAEKTNEFPRELWNRCVELGFIGVSMPVEYGGLGMRRVMDKIVLEEIAKESPALALSIDAHHLATRWLLNYGSKAQKEKYLPQMVFGEMIGASANTDLNSAIPTMETQPMGEITQTGFLLNGTKFFCTNSSVADVIITTGIVGGKYMVLLLEKDMEGLIRGGKLVDHKLGMHGSGTGTVQYKNLLVPFTNALVPEDPQHMDPFGTIDCFVDISAISLGIAESAFNKTFEYLINRTRNGQPLAAMQVVANHLAKMKAKVEMMRSMVYRTTEELERHNDPLLVHACKATVTEMAIDVCETAIMLHGGTGYMEATGVARYLRDAVCDIIGETPIDQHYDQIALQLGIPVKTSQPFYPIVGDLKK